MNFFQNTYDKFCCEDTLPYDSGYQLCCADGSVNYYNTPCSTLRKRRSVVDSSAGFFEFVKNSQFYEG